MSFLEPRRQHPLGVLILAAQFAWRFAQQVWPALVVGSFGDNVLKSGLITASIFLTLCAAYAVLYYFRFKFSVEGEVLVVEKGVLSRERLQVPFERIQTIQLYQGPLQQVFSLTGVRVDTAGSSGSELQLVAIRKSEATALQAILRKTSDPGGMEVELATLTEEDQKPNPEAQRVASRTTPLVSLGPASLLKVGLSQNHLRNAFAGMALVLYGLGNVPEMITAWMESVPAIAAPLVGLAFFLLIIPGILLFLIGGVVVSFGTAFLKYFRLQSEIGAEGLHAEMGLLRRQSFDVPFTRIHLTEWRSNWIRRQLGFETLEVRQAMAESGAMNALRVHLPAMEPHHRKTFEDAVYPDMKDAPVFTFGAVRRWRWLMWLGVSAPAALWLASGVGLVSGAALVGWVGFTFWSTSRRFDSLRLTAYTDSIVLEKGWFWKRRTVLRMAQLQGVEWERWVLLERRSIGHLVFHTAAGARRFPYVDRASGHALRDFALNQQHAKGIRA